MIGFQHSATQPDLGANQNELQLGEQLSLMLEDSKWQLETILDEQNDVFAVLDTQRRILRSNQALARLLGCDPELCIGSTLESLLAPESLEMFRTLVSEVFHESDRNLSSSRQIELPVRNSETGALIPFWWSIQMIRLGRRGETPLPALLLTGRDISDLRGKERQIDEMFAGIPLGILGVGREGRIQGIYSNYSRIFMGERNVIGERLGSIISDLAGADFSQSDREAFGAFEVLFGEPQLMVELVLETMPKEHKIRKAGLYNSEGVMGLTYQPVFRDGGLEKILVLMEDRTQLAREREERAQSGGDDPDSQRMAHVKRQTPEFLSFVEGDAEGFLTRALREMRARNHDGLATALHGLKGTVRVARFDLLFPRIQELEGLIKKWARDEDQSSWGDHWTHITGQMVEIEKEWRLTKTLIKAVYGDGAEDPAKKFDERFVRRIARLVRLSHHAEVQRAPERMWIRQDRLALLQWWSTEESLETTLHFLDEQIRRNESTFACGVIFDPEVYRGRVAPKKRRDIMEILLHLVNNAFAHALEPEHVRLERGKPARMKLGLKVGIKARKIRIEFTDDGRGIHSDKLRQKLVDLKLKSEQEAKAMSDEDAQNAVFIAGLSTQSNRDEVSGTGVGLSAVLKRVQANGGKLRLISVPDQGSKFIIQLPLISRLSQRAELLSTEQLIERLKSIADLTQEPKEHHGPERRYRIPLDRTVACLLALARYPLDQDVRPQLRLASSINGSLELGISAHQAGESAQGWLSALQLQERRAAAKDLKALGFRPVKKGNWYILRLEDAKS